MWKDAWDIIMEETILQSYHKVIHLTAIHLISIK